MTVKGFPGERRVATWPLSDSRPMVAIVSYMAGKSYATQHLGQAGLDEMEAGLMRQEG